MSVAAAMRRRARIALPAALLLAAAAALPAQIWEVDEMLLEPAEGEAGDEYGRAVATGDFDGDGLDDLAVGSPGALSGTGEYAGRVDVYLGTGGRQLAPPIALEGFLDDDCAAGFALAAGNVDADPADELFYGAPSCGGGRVYVASWNGSGFGIGFFDQENTGSETSESSDFFGLELATGDVNGDGFDDLLVGSPGEEVTIQLDVGMVHLLLGSPTGIANESSQLFVGNSFVPGIATQGEEFGTAIAVGDFDADGFDDVAISAPGRTLSAQSEAGQVHVAYGTPGGLATTGSQLFDDSSFGFTREAGDRFGTALAAGNFDAQGGISCIGAQDPCAEDLAIGNPDEAIGAVPAAGHVIVVFGSAASGLQASEMQHFDQSDFGFSLEAGDRFGLTLAAGRIDSRDFSDSGRWAEDLAIGSPTESLYGTSDGVVLFLFGAPGGFSAVSAQLVAQSPGTPTYPPVADTGFGMAVAIADFDADGAGDVAVGIPENRSDQPVTAGAVALRFGALFADGFESGGVSFWSSVAI